MPRLALNENEITVLRTLVELAGGRRPDQVDLRSIASTLGRSENDVLADCRILNGYFLVDIDNRPDGTNLLRPNVSAISLVRQLQIPQPSRLKKATTSLIGFQDVLISFRHWTLAFKPIGMPSEGKARSPSQ
jgi:hypothetical protein